MHNCFLTEHKYSQFLIYKFKSELKFWKVKIIIVIILLSRIIIK